MAKPTKIDYENKLILAPMVRINSLPTRLLSLDYGADLVYSEEIIDHKILAAQRIENKLLGTVDYEMPDGTIIFRTCPKEEGKVVFQMGTADAERALKAAKKLEKDVLAIDVNMGCPQLFSLKGGMGAALLTQPEKIKNILTTLVNGLNIPVSCKIRILPELSDTLELVKLIERTGVCAIGVHGRTIDERPRHPNQNNVIKAITQTVNIPVIANGGSKEILCYNDIESFKQETNTKCVMLARAAQWNPSIFRKDGLLPLEDVIKQHIKYAVEYDINAMNTKYCLLQIMHNSMDMAEGQPMLDSKHLSEMCDIWKLEEFYKTIQRMRIKKRERLMDDENIYNNKIIAKRMKTEDGSILIQLPVRFIKSNYPGNISPKQLLHTKYMKKHTKAPPYNTVQRDSDKCFKSVLCFDGKKYTTPYWEKSKQLAEQGAAITCLISLGVHDGRINNNETEDEDLRSKWREMISDNNSVQKSTETSSKPAGESCNAQIDKKEYTETSNQIGINGEDSDVKT
ncbi:hypothetical protein LOTGIDRAFT_191598 [Lottia gigantea]|uniref:DRBM domain-containing protein n=1 Tax=Lottia gigantea TaxID=225164 RepID=V4A320_LOTGI|nr:hypothetical protein LOTGIDRAFT_191598 [Lottia gigantea]ESO91102.1 hypothetical protein LOTGIDRAFT_191598 [Lottia gigantea]